MLDLVRDIVCAVLGFAFGLVLALVVRNRAR
jgi:hypothetical protein